MHAIGVPIGAVVGLSGKIAPKKLSRVHALREVQKSFFFVQALYTATSATVDAIPWAPTKFHECLLWAGEKIMNGVSWSSGKFVDVLAGLDIQFVNGVAESARSVGKGAVEVPIATNESNRIFQAYNKACTTCSISAERFLDRPSEWSIYNYGIFSLRGVSNIIWLQIL